ncbi:MAG: hypothetical protein OEW05_13495, partial [Candidatus Aminicenantes bacterium]|nr:hypothetical protein [Candidatus Aminicenantes bacterium]
MDGTARLTMAGVDIAVVAAYLIGIVGLGIWAWARRRKRAAAGPASSEYFLAGGSLRWPVIGL